MPKTQKEKPSHTKESTCDPFTSFRAFSLPTYSHLFQKNPIPSLTTINEEMEMEQSTKIKEEEEG